MISSKQPLNEQEIFSLLKNTLKKSYCKYSHFHVASILETKLQDQYIYYFGVNVENASYSLTCCAERNAIFSFIVNKSPTEQINKIYLLGTDEKLINKDIITPCGACLQVMSEFFNKNNQIICYSINNKRKIFTISQLLPQKFSLKE